ncbi:hypothetical protein C0993_007756 [Termitomyces sp. T159_Od127]|nr:hypothetical protein C0993_007756 [Termitomyces sp. T159_Od127]
MAEQAEEAFIRTFLSTLSSQTVVYPDDYQQPPSNSLKKVPVLPIAVPPVPKRAVPHTAGTSYFSAPQHPHTPKRSHQRIPSVVLSPSPSGESQVAEKDILLTLDNTSSSVAIESLSTYGQTVAKPEFWQHLYDFLKSEFTTSADALTAWEDFFCASKGSLTVNQIAKIRDQVGIVGMAGT